MADNLSEKLEHILLLSKKHLWQSLSRNDSNAQQRIFVAGMQRSGTNMLMDVLEQSYETAVFHERDSRAFDNYQMREIPVLKTLTNRTSAPAVVIKSLCELDKLSELMQAFTPAKTIWIVRDYNDVVNSMLRSFGNMAKQVHRIVKNPDSDEWLAGGMSDETRTILKELVHDNLDDANASALQWYFRNILFFEQSFDTNENVKLISYERLVTDPAAEFKSIFDFSGLRFSPRVARKVSPRSIGKNPPPSIEDPIKELCDGLLARFQALLGRVSDN